MTGSGGLVTAAPGTSTLALSPEHQSVRMSEINKNLC